ncbi:MAG: pilin [Magnetococcales bacterium]|nr:pilin [Magnetococcales bacterium]
MLRRLCFFRMSTYFMVAFALSFFPIRVIFSAQDAVAAPVVYVVDGVVKGVDLVGGVSAKVGMEIVVPDGSKKGMVFLIPPDMDVSEKNGLLSLIKGSEGTPIKIALVKSGDQAVIVKVVTQKGEFGAEKYFNSLALVAQVGEAIGQLAVAKLHTVEYYVAKGKWPSSLDEVYTPSPKSKFVSNITGSFNAQANRYTITVTMQSDSKLISGKQFSLQTFDGSSWDCGPTPGSPSAMDPSLLPSVCRDSLVGLAMQPKADLPKGKTPQDKVAGLPQSGTSSAANMDGSYEKENGIIDIKTQGNIVRFSVNSSVDMHVCDIENAVAQMVDDHRAAWTPDDKSSCVLLLNFTGGSVKVTTKDCASQCGMNAIGSMDGIYKRK